MDKVQDIFKPLLNFNYTKFVVTAILIASFWIISKIVRKWLNFLAEKYQKKRIVIKNFIPIFNIVLNIIAVLIILFWVLKIPSESLLTIGVSGGIAVGFAIKDLLANIFGGLVVIFTRPFNIGDKITINDYYGEVTDVSLLKVMITTPDDSTVSIPSKIFLESSVVNANSGELNCQVVTKVFLPGDINLQLVKKVAKEAVYSSPYIFLKKPVVILFRDEFKEASLITLIIKAYVYDHRYEYKFSTDIYERLKRYFGSHNVINRAFYSMPQK